MRFAVVLSALLLVFLPPSTSNPLGAPTFSAWGTPSNLGPVVNSPFVDGGPGISKKGLSLYFHSNRPGGMGDTDIWVSQRSSIHDPWGPPVHAGPTINTSFAETVPTFSRDEHWMFFASTRPGGQGGNDIWASWRQHTHDDFGWQPPVNLGPNINTAFFDAGQAFFEGDGIFPPMLFFVSNRPGGFGGQDFWVSTRASLGSTWTLPENLGPSVNSAADDFQPQLSSDRKMLLFASNRPGGFGDFDLYTTVRSGPGR